MGNVQYTQCKYTFSTTEMIFIECVAIIGKYSFSLEYNHLLLFGMVNHEHFHLNPMWNSSKCNDFQFCCFSLFFSQFQVSKHFQTKYLSRHHTRFAKFVNKDKTNNISCFSSTKQRFLHEMFQIWAIFTSK